MSIFPLTLLMKELHVVFPISMKKEKKETKKEPQLSLITILLCTNSVLNSTSKVGSS